MDSADNQRPNSAAPAPLRSAGMGGGRSALSGVLMLQCLDLLQDNEELVTEFGKAVFDMGRAFHINYSASLDDLK